MSESRATSPELEQFSAHISFTEEQLTYLQATVVNEIAMITRARELRGEADKLAKIATSWNWSEDILSKGFNNFFDDNEYLKYDGKVLDTNEFWMPLNLAIQTEHPTLNGRKLGEFDLDAINLNDGKVIVSSVVVRDNPLDTEGETESWFSFIVDPNVAEQNVGIYFMAADDEGQASHQALLPILAGDESDQVNVL
jgi:hypothetical protein